MFKKIEAEIKHLKEVETTIHKYNREVYYDELRQLLTDEIWRCQREDINNEPYVSNLLQTKSKQLASYEMALKKKTKNKFEKYAPTEYSQFV